MISLNTRTGALLALLTLGVSAAAADGPALYREHCAKCHGDTGQADNWRGYLFFSRNFTNPDWQKKMSDDDILTEIDDGPRIMPAYRDKLNREQKTALLKVIRSFGGK